jgi:hypothetical protein
LNTERRGGRGAAVGVEEVFMVGPFIGGGTP